MIASVLKKIFGSRNDRLLRQFQRVVEGINALEPEVAGLSDEALRAKTEEFRRRLTEAVDAAAPRTSRAPAATSRRSRWAARRTPSR